MNETMDPNRIAFYTEAAEDFAADLIKNLKRFCNNDESFNGAPHGIRADKTYGMFTDEETEKFLEKVYEVTYTIYSFDTPVAWAIGDVTDINNWDFFVDEELNTDWSNVGRHMIRAKKLVDKVTRKAE